MIDDFATLESDYIGELKLEIADLRATLKKDPDNRYIAEKIETLKGAIHEMRYGNKPRKARKPRPRYPTESQEMQALAQYLDAKGYLWCHVPNEGRRSPRNGARLKREGVKRGVPDVLVFAPRQLAIELKRVKGKPATDEQTAWLYQLSKAGWKTFVANGSEAAIEFVNFWTSKERMDK